MARSKLKDRNRVEVLCGKIQVYLKKHKQPASMREIAIACKTTVPKVRTAIINFNRKFLRSGHGTGVSPYKYVNRGESSAT